MQEVNHGWPGKDSIIAWLGLARGLQASRQNDRGSVNEKRTKYAHWQKKKQKKFIPRTRGEETK